MGNNEVREHYSVSSLVLGIISIINVCFYYVSIPTSIIAIVLGIKEYRYSKSKIGLTGFILGIVGASLTLLVGLIYTLIIIFNYL